MATVDNPIYWAATAIARRDNVSRQAVSKHIARLTADHGLDIKRSRAGRIEAVNVVDYDRLMNRYVDSAKQRPATKPSSSAAQTQDADTLDGQRRRLLALQSEKLRLELAEQNGLLVRADVMGASIQRLAEEITRTLDLSQHADIIANAFSSGGLHGLRIELKTLTTTMRTAIANQCAGLSLTAPTHDPALTSSETLFSTS